MKISVIIPTYNRREQVIKAIRSALAQTFASFEILVCDDGSTDGTREAVHEIKDPRVRWVPGKGNSGLPAVPRNRGIRESRGDWLAFLDSDDEWYSEKLAEQKKAIARSGASAVCANADRVNAQGTPNGLVVAFEKNVISFDDLLRANTVVSSSMLLKKSLFDDVSGFPEERDLKAGEDHALWLRIATRSDILFIHEPLLSYRDDPASSVRGTHKDAHMAGLRLTGRVIGNFLRWASGAGVSRDRIYQAEKRMISLRYDMARYEAYKMKRWFGGTSLGKAIERFFKTRCRHGAAKTPQGGFFEVDNWMVSRFVLAKIVPIAGTHPFPLAELMLMASSVCGVRPTHIFEWGTHIGKSARIFYETARYFNISVDIHSIDLPDDVEHGEHPKGRRGELVRGLSNVYLHQGDGLETSSVLCEKLDASARVLFFLDGDHSYGSVKREFSYIAEHFPRAAVLLHDTFYQVPASGYNIGPYEALEEVLSLHPGAYERIDMRTGLPGMTLVYPKELFS